jgi:hypothetical protein
MVALIPASFLNRGTEPLTLMTTHPAGTSLQIVMEAHCPHDNLFLRPTMQSKSAVYPHCTRNQSPPMMTT